ncbi:hypothetical protein YPPY32_5032, partial [Yersinia pestis PY-32]
MPLPQPLQ